MQLAGNSCGFCKQNILIETEATWCSRCATVLHHHCLEKSGEVCPICQQAYEKPEQHFVFSEQCPDCFRLNQPRRAACASCGTRTRWDNKAAYNDFLLHMKDTARVRALRGCAELVVAGLCLLLLLFFRVPGIFGLGLLLLGFMTLTTDGILSLLRSKQIARFR